MCFKSRTHGGLCSRSMRGLHVLILHIHCGKEGIKHSFIIHKTSVSSGVLKEHYVVWRRDFSQKRNILFFMPKQTK